MPSRRPYPLHPFPDKKLTKNSNGLLILHFAISLKRPFTADNIQNISPNKFKKRYEVERYLRQLADWELVDNLGESTYQINEEGIKYAHLVANYYRQIQPNRTADRAYA
jgi:hypothetical protein